MLQPADTLILLYGMQVFGCGFLGVMCGRVQSLVSLAVLLLLLQEKQSWRRVL
jgi:hypothetical protein